MNDNISVRCKKLYKKYPNIVEDLRTRPEKYNACMEELMEKEKSGEVFVIAPETLHGVGRTEADPDKLTKLYEEGYQQAKKQMEDLKRYLGMEEDIS